MYTDLKTRGLWHRGRVRARGPRKRASEMNKAEAEYAGILEARKRAGEIEDYWFESVKLRLADKTWYNCDFMVLTSVMEVELHEVKAQWSTGKAGIEEDAQVKMKVIAETYPFRLRIACKTKTGFQITEI